MLLISFYKLKILFGCGLDKFYIENEGFSEIIATIKELSKERMEMPIEINILKLIPIYMYHLQEV